MSHPSDKLYFVEAWRLPRGCLYDCDGMGSMIGGFVRLLAARWVFDERGCFVRDCLNCWCVETGSRLDMSNRQIEINTVATFAHSETRLLRKNIGTLRFLNMGKVIAAASREYPSVLPCRVVKITCRWFGKSEFQPDCRSYGQHEM
jgi:hypothetical protein